MTGKEIREIRQSLNYTQAILAMEIGVTSNTVARYERDEVKPSRPVVKLLDLLKAKKGKRSNAAK